MSFFDNSKEKWEYPELDYGYENSFADLLHDCFRKHVSGEKVFTDGQEARKNLEIIMAAYKSARTGKTVMVGNEKDS
ncbi:MAG: hypothetical protein KAQ69_10420 [Spirochaetales bacterium]|nr:hypothetical protein [Spirochaetales bacterium]